MNPLDVADLVVIAGKTLDLGSQAALDRLDLGAAQTAVSEAAAAADSGDPALAAAALLAALIQHRPWDGDTGPVAVAAATTFLALNGWQADLDPPEAVREVVAALGAGRLDVAGLTEWLSPRLSQTCVKEAPMHGWIPGRSKSGRRKGTLFQRFSHEARQVVVGSQEEARSLRHGYIGTEHLLLGLLRQDSGVAAQALHAAGVSAEAARQAVLDIIGRGHQVPHGHVPFTPRAKKVLQLSLREARQLGHLYIGSEHLLLGLLREGQGVACQVLSQLGADADAVREHVAELSGQPEVPASRSSRPGSGTTTCASPRPGGTRTPRWTRATPRRRPPRAAPRSSSSPSGSSSSRTGRQAPTWPPSAGRSTGSATKCAACKICCSGTASARKKTPNDPPERGAPLAPPGPRPPPHSPYCRSRRRARPSAAVADGQRPGHPGELPGPVQLGLPVGAGGPVRHRHLHFGHPEALP